MTTYEHSNGELILHDHSPSIGRKASTRKDLAAETEIPLLDNRGMIKFYL